MTLNLQPLVEELERYEALEIGEARALPMEMYTSPALFELEMERVFRKEWLCVGRLEQVRERGDYFSVEILGEPLVIVRGADDQVRALSSVCRHRYYSAVEGAGNAKSFRCPYHRWVYGLDGELRGAPHMEKVVGSDRAACRLPSFPVEIWQGFIFVSLNAEATPIAPKLAGAEPYWRNYDMANQRVTPWVDEIWPGNWKLAMETALEGYHVTGLHPGTIAEFMPSRTSEFESTSSQWTLFRLGTVYEGEFERYKPYADRMEGEDRTSAPQFGFFPNCAVSCAPFASIWLTFLPIDVGHTRVIGGNLMPTDLFEEVGQSEALQAALSTGINAINAQDASAMVNLQRNASSRHAEPGLLSQKEKCLLYFYRYLGGRLGTRNVTQAVQSATA